MNPMTKKVVVKLFTELGRNRNKLSSSISTKSKYPDYLYGNVQSALADVTLTLLRHAQPTRLIPYLHINTLSTTHSIKPTYLAVYYTTYVQLTNRNVSLQRHH